MRVGDMAKAVCTILPLTQKVRKQQALAKAKKNGTLDIGQTEHAAAENGLSTIWGERIQGGYRDYLQEYPRPQMVRVYKNKNVNEQRGKTVVFSGEGYFNLNGVWSYAVTKSETPPTSWDEEILVPFSPESMLGGEHPTLQPDAFLWYEKCIVMERALEADERVLLHFGAVDQMCEIYINGTQIASHAGGYLPFTTELTEKLVQGENRLLVKVTDTTNASWHTRGKQKLKSGGMFYHAQSGIWQTVWMETVPQSFIKDIKITPLYDRHEVKVQIFTDGAHSLLECELLDDTFVIANVVSHKTSVTLPLPEDFKAWTPERPFLYRLHIKIASGDCVRSYVAMRTFTKEKDAEGVWRLCLNHQPYFQNGVLHQGYWSDSLMTAPDDEALVYDITQMKEAGFQMLRVHCKIESLRFYYHCDRLGMLVWQDMVNGGEEYSSLRVTYIPTVMQKFSQRKDNDYKKLKRASKRGRMQWQRECLATLHLLYNSPCVCMWVLFNEGWGQFDSLQAVENVSRFDKTRMIDHASGWFDQGGGDVRSVHRYFEELRVETDPLSSERAFVISEYGGFAYKVAGHVYGKNLYSYRTYYTQADYRKAFWEVQAQIAALVPKGLSAAVYTQVSDIEEEMNGLLTFDRRVNKVTPGGIEYREESQAGRISSVLDVEK